MVSRHFLVTAGNTRELIDEVRDWGNIFTGKTGLDMALALLEAGDVTLLTSNTHHAAEFDGKKSGAGTLRVRTFMRHPELESGIAGVLQERKTAAVLMSAAVADYRPDGAYQVLSAAAGAEGRETWVVERVQRGKVKGSYDRVAFTGVPTRKIVDQFRGTWGFTGYLVKFKLEVGISEEELIGIAAASRVHSGADIIVANTLEMVRGENPGAWVIGEGLRERTPRGALAERVKALVLAGIGT